MHLAFTILLLALVALAVLFYAKFTRYGAVPLAAAWRSYTAWLCLVGMAFGQFVVDGLSWLAGFWESFSAQFGPILDAPAAGKALQLLSAFFFLLRMKGQGFPALQLPDLPDDTDKAGA